jgi:hypothetical protein
MEDGRAGSTGSNYNNRILVFHHLAAINLLPQKRSAS